MAINITHRPDLDNQVERLAVRLELSGRGRKTAVIEKALKALEEQVARYASQSEIRASLNRFVENGQGLREEILEQNPELKEPLSKTLQDELYDEQGIPK